MIHRNHHRHHDAIHTVIFDHSLGTLRQKIILQPQEHLCAKMSELTLKLTNKKRKQW